MKGHQYRNITRVDHGRTHGFNVRFQRWKDGEPLPARTKLFSDRKYGGRRAALGAAVTWRDENEHLHPKSSPPGKGTGRKPEEVGYENVMEFARKFTRADGTTYTVPVLYAKIKVSNRSKRKFATTQRSLGSRSRAAVMRDIEAWFEKHRRKIRSAA